MFAVYVGLGTQGYTSQVTTAQTQNCVSSKGHTQTQNCLDTDLLQTNTEELEQLCRLDTHSPGPLDKGNESPRFPRTSAGGT